MTLRNFDIYLKADGTATQKTNIGMLRSAHKIKKNVLVGTNSLQLLSFLSESRNTFQIDGEKISSKHLVYEYSGYNYACK